MSKSEAQTRSELIDQQLSQSGWNVKDPTQVIEEFDILTAFPQGVAEPRTPYEGHQFSDYVLLGKDRKPLAVVEAKKSSKDAAIGREQAKQYCYNIQNQLGGELPFCFYTNGLETHFWDLGSYPPRKVVGFPTRDDLERFAYIRRNRKPLTQEFINTSIAGRDYQIRAIRAVLEGIEQQKRDFLLVMATGTGKTRTCIAMADALMRAGHAEKILFLVDRIALREQALAAFKEHLPNEPRWPNVGEKLIATFDDMVAKLGPLMKFREQSSGQEQTHLDLADELHKKEWVEFGPQHEAVSVSRYREMVEALIVELTEHNPVLQKIKNGEVVSTDETNELAELLHEEHPHITEALLRQVYKNRKAHFIQFIRHILGIEVLQSFPDTVSAAFDRFIRAHTTLNSRQLEFLGLLKNFIVEREKVEKRDLINTPFTVIHPQGIRGVFSPAEINEILQLTERLAA